MKGPEPTALEICADAGVLATASGMTNRALESGLASASSTRPNGSRSAKVKVRSSTASSLAPAENRALPTTSRSFQRRIEATASAARTGLPSWNFRPLRRRNIQALRLSETCQLSTICGCGLPRESSAKS